MLSDTPSSPSSVTEADRREETDPAGLVSPAVIKPFPGVIVYPDRPAAEIQATSCLTSGWLEQIVCSPGTREHEALLVTAVKPHQIHAALLLAGFQPGSPGRWFRENGVLTFISPKGDALELFVRYPGAGGEMIEEPVRNWISDHLGRQTFPPDPWIFAGSRFAENPSWMGPGEHYVADLTGSIIGLVTFGDEVVGFSRVLADDSSVQKPEWEVASDRVPPLGTPVTLILRPFVPHPVPGDS
ncbi:MAG: hypothetical protein JSV91_10100 [Phycisphaerales bacterium]|nr:MAG: hypothetical protein JSV91_10100 [Phycisphaerales bacterium]